METLRACALTCRAWRHRSQAHLFLILGVACVPSEDRINDVVELLQRNSALQSHVEVLSANGHGGDEWSTLHLIPLALPRYIRGVKRLRMGHGHAYFPPGVFTALRQFTSVTELTLAYVTFHSLADARRIMSSFLSLQFLRLRCLNWHGAHAAHLVPAMFPPCKVRPTRINVAAKRTWLLDSRSAYLVQWIGRSGMASCLQDFDTDGMMILDEKMLSAVGSVLLAAQTTLKEVRLDLGPELKFDNCESSHPFTPSILT